MTLDPHARRFLERLSIGAPRSAGALSVEERRAALARLLSLGGEPPEVSRVAAYDIPGPDGAMHLRAYDPLDASAARLPALVFFHGGGLVAGNLDTHDGIARSLANASGCRLLAVDYRLGPEAPFPAALQDASTATEWVIDHAAELGVDPDRLGVCGDSAGAALAVALCQQRAAGRGSGIALQVLLCPILDYRAETIARRPYDQGDLLDRMTLEHDVAHYLQAGSDPADPRVSPLEARRFADLPPACIHTAECDPVREDGSEYARKLHAAGVPVSYHCHAGMIHLFYGLGMVIPYVAEAYRTIGAEIRTALG
jgi:acetyl esterase